jgi:hypothetical protein
VLLLLLLVLLLLLMGTLPKRVALSVTPRAPTIIVCFAPFVNQPLATCP